MSRYIKGKPDFADCEKCSRTYGTLGCCSTVSNEWVYSCLEGMLEKAYADGIKSVEPKRGEWKPFDLTWGRSIWYCTACEESTEVPCDIWKHKPIYKYCPNCGADMREREGE